MVVGVAVPPVPLDAGDLVLGPVSDDAGHDPVNDIESNSWNSWM